MWQCLTAKQNLMQRKTVEVATLYIFIFIIYDYLTSIYKKYQKYASSKIPQPQGEPHWSIFIKVTQNDSAHQIWKVATIDFLYQSSNCTFCLGGKGKHVEWV
jgi:hypothetical protein